MSLMSFFRKMIIFLVRTNRIFLCFPDHKQRCYFLIEQVKYCVIIKTGDSNLYLVFSFSLRSIFTICSPTPGKLFYLISDKTLLNQNHFLLLSNCYITAAAARHSARVKGSLLPSLKKNSICLIV